MSRAKPFIKNISWNYVSAAADILVFFILTPVIIQHFGTTVYGVWILLHVIMFYLDFFDLGLYTALVKFVAKYRETGDYKSMNEVIGSTLTMMAFSGIAAFAASILIAWFFVPYYFDVSEEMINTLMLAVILFGANLLISFPGSVFGAIFEGYQRYDVIGAIGTVMTILTAVSSYIVIVVYDAGILLLAMVNITGGIIAIALYVIFVARLFPEVKPRFSAVGGKNWKRLRSYSWWTAINEMLSEGASGIDSLLIPVFISLSMVTPYSLVCSIAGAMFLMIDPITDVFFSLSSALEARDSKRQLRTLLLKGTKLVMCICLPISLCTLAYGEAFLVWWVGAEYVTLDGPVLELIVASCLVTAFIITSSHILMALAHLKQLFIISVIELIIAVTLAILTLSEYGLVGLAFSFLVANSLVTFLMMVPYVCKTLDQNITEFLHDSLFRPLLALLPSLVVVYALDQSLLSDGIIELVLKGTIVSCIYLFSFYILSLSKAEKDEYGGHIREMIFK